MKKTYTTLIAGLSLIGILFLLGNSTGAPAMNTGAPGEQTCGQVGCHGVPVNQGSAVIAIDFNGGAEAYTAGEIHTVTVSITNPMNAGKNGFQIVALDSANNNVGQWMLTSATTTQLANGSGALSGRRYVTHTTNGNSRTEWSMDWQAPADVAAGAVTFYVAVNDANNDSTNFGDAIYTTNRTIAPAVVSGVDNALAASIKLLGNPITDVLRIQSNGTAIQSYQIFDFSGKLLQTARYQPEIDVTALESGVYLLLLQTEKGNVTKKIIVR